MPSQISPELAAAGAALTETLGAGGFSRWSELDARFQAALDGPFDLTDPRHQVLALGLTALVGERLCRDQKGFWFAHRDAVGGASIGFPDAVMPVSPSALVSEALREGTLVRLDVGFEDLQRDLTAARSSAKKFPRAMGPDDYAKLLDPSFIEFSAIDAERAAGAYERSPAEVAGLLQDALFRAPGLSRDGRHFAEDLSFSLRSLDSKNSLVAQAAKQPRVFERVTHLFGAVYGTGPIALGGWMEVAVRLICLDAGRAPPVPSDVRGAVAKVGGVVPLFLATAPRLAEAPREGVLGLFSPSELQPVDRRVTNLGESRMIGVNPRTLLVLLKEHDPQRVKAAVDAFSSALSVSPAAKELAMLQDALGFVRRLQDTLAYAIRDQLNFCLLRLSEIEARNLSAIGPVRQVLDS